MRESAVMFRLPVHILSNLEALSRRLDVSVNIVAKLIVTREVMHIPAMLEEHDRQLANIHQFLRELAFRNEEFLSEGEVRVASAKAIAQQLENVMGALDAIRDAAYVRPSTFIADLIRNHDDRYVQKSLRI
ncbi:hypothetical protein ELI49_37360 [Rhizobium ruizarguesonis]|uniref:Uncharacterized protein n=1 Tax=Rhizobium ruizarguesonis TaxID=2081791 RepID=A0AAE8Q4H6_9HYPH|nr:hypothetical protein [Rhizobium ruizarguesonis]NEH87455.1 hypothetical protein [Rhizobium ruizarguesonis]NEI16431.1 hypothetical protein [Rhizobium ruizarguesonis]NEJ08654.1 hypothetical protein [Rhizobium ruizarguesonis]NEJ17062.1 hypothetical protein [Rhizobium ruizarguesonis]NEJ59490.1 hypothetical protein [Rhizobium ruizarguesonis]